MTECAILETVVRFVLQGDDLSKELGGSAGMSPLRTEQRQMSKAGACLLHQ